MFDWWNSLNIATQVFYCIAVPSTLILIIQTLVTFLGGSDGVEGEADVGTADDISAGGVDAVDGADGVFGDEAADNTADPAGLSGLRIITFRGIIAFLVVFGWVGVAMDSSGAKLWLTLPIAFVCGFAMMLSLALIFRAVMRLRNDGNADNRNAVGTSGKVQLTIPPARSGEGKVHLMLQGAYVERNAVTDEGEAIPTGAEVIVVGVSGQTDLVVKRK